MITNVLLACILVTQVVTTFAHISIDSRLDVINHCVKQIYLDAGVIRTYTKWLTVNKE